MRNQGGYVGDIGEQRDEEGKNELINSFSYILVFYSKEKFGNVSVLK